MNRFFIGDKVYLSYALEVEGYECLMEECEELGIEVSDIYGIITATNLGWHDDLTQDPTYRVTWINGKTKTEIITCLGISHYVSEELSTDGTKFLQGYRQAKEMIEEAKEMGEWCD